MCMMAPSMPAYKPLVRKEKVAGQASPDDMVNNQVVDNVNDRSKQDEFRQANRGQIASGQKSTRSGLQTNKAY